MPEVRRLIPLVRPSLPRAAGSPGTSRQSAPTSGEFSITDALQPDGPLRGIAFTGHVDREDPKVRPTLAFTTRDTEVTAVIGLGDVEEGSTVVVTWYRVRDGGTRGALLARDRRRAWGGQAFSQAVAPTGLAPGIYDTEATMDGQSPTRRSWCERRGSQTGATAQAASGDEDWNVPMRVIAGGAMDPNLLPQQDPRRTRAGRQHQRGHDPIAGRQGARALGGPCTTGTLTATVSGPPTTIASSDTSRGTEPTSTGKTDVCSLAGGSDLPGTVVHFEATGSANGSEDYTLPDHGEALLAEARRHTGGREQVEAGDGSTSSRSRW